VTSILTDADSLIHGDRNADYGHPLDDYTKTGWLWAPILYELWLVPAFVRAGLAPPTMEELGPVPAEAAILAMVQVKVSRELNAPKRDNRTDGAGYFGCLDMVANERAERSWGGDQP
jgi:hypothetical protein